MQQPDKYYTILLKEFLSISDGFIILDVFSINTCWIAFFTDEGTFGKVHFPKKVFTCIYIQIKIN